jgi:hypothetical protein
MVSASTGDASTARPQSRIAGEIEGSLDELNGPLQRLRRMPPL